MEGLSPLHLIILLVVAILVLGPGKLPEVGAALGKTIREFRSTVTGLQESVRLDSPPAPAAAPAPPLPAQLLPAQLQSAPPAPAPAMPASPVAPSIPVAPVSTAPSVATAPVSADPVPPADAS